MVSKVENGYKLLKSMRSRLDEAKDKIENLKLEYERSENKA